MAQSMRRTRDMLGPLRVNFCLGCTSKWVNTPSTKVSLQCDDLLENYDATAHSTFAAKVNYLAQNESDIEFAVRELCRNMSSPHKLNWDGLKRLGRHSGERPRVASMFASQQMPDAVTVHVDTDRAGCLVTRRPTKVEVAMFGEHCLRIWSVSQQMRALSSSEAVYYSMTRSAGVVFSILGVICDMNVVVSIAVCTDSSAAKEFDSSRELRKVRHVELSEIWLRDRVARGKVSLVKVVGDDNFGNVATEHVPADRVEQTLRATSNYVRSRRHDIVHQSAGQSQYFMPYCTVHHVC